MPTMRDAKMLLLSLLLSLITRGSHAYSISLERNAPRAQQIQNFQNWASSFAQTENGFALAPLPIPDQADEEWCVYTSTGAPAGSRVLFVPDNVILSANRIAQEYKDFAQPCLQYLSSRSSVLKFFLFLKVLVEYEQGQSSPYYPWLDAMPRKWNTAVSMTEFCLSCLPPYILKICEEQRDELLIFEMALREFPYLSHETKVNKELLKFAFNIVNTRAVPDYDDLHIIPLADMFNHRYPANAQLSYEPSKGCSLVLTQDIGPNQELCLSYGMPTNPSRFLATYGFLDTSSPATYCKIIISNPSQEMINIGYDENRMLFYTQYGDISQEVWDVVLYQRLERKPEYESARRAFYQAHMSGDTETKSKIHSHFMKETSFALLLHVNHILSEVAELTVKMYKFDASKHPRLPLLRKHHDMVTDTFQKVKANLEPIFAQAKTMAVY